MTTRGLENLRKTIDTIKGPDPYYEEPDNFKEPCQDEKEELQRKESAKKKSTKK
jgi:hypothetical protein